jgi:hypothetical protein
MRKIASTAAVLLAVSVGLLVASPAHADAAAVLTTGSLGGPNVAVGDVVSSGLKSGTTAKFFTTAGGTTGVTCSVSQFTGSILTNPAAGGVATESLTAQTFSSCTSNIFGVTAVQSITVNNLAYGATLNGATKALTLTGGAPGPIQATVRLSTLFGTVTCVYRAVGNTFAGSANNADNSLNFTSQQLTKFSGPVVCPGNSFFTASYAPARDTTVAGSPLVFVQ